MNRMWKLSNAIRVINGTRTNPSIFLDKFESFRSFSTSNLSSDQQPKESHKNIQEELQQPENFFERAKDLMTKNRTFHCYLPQRMRKYFSPVNLDIDITSSTSTSISTPESPNNGTKVIKTIKYIPIEYTLSNLAGHGSFICLALSYLESDFLHLRMYAFTGISLAMFFQYYREKPLWIPIRWNSLFLLINLVMIITLLKDENDASNLTEEEKLLYKAVFEKRGMKPVDYLHLISMSKRLEFHKHDKLVDEKKMNNRVYLVLHGKLAVMKYGLTVGWIEEGHFVGEMSYLSWSSAMNTMKESLQQLSSSSSTISSTEKNEQQSLTTKEMMNGNLSYQKTRSLKKFMDLLSDYSPLLSHAHSESTSTSSSNENNNDNNPGNEGARVQADVICTEDCVLYAWNFQDLHELIHSYPSLGFVFERCLSEELNRKFSSNPSAKTPLPSSSSSSSTSSALQSPALFSSSRGDSSSPSSSSSPVSPADSSFAAVLVQASHENMLAYYKQILYGAIMDNEVNETEREIIRQFREKYSITLEEHQQLLAEFHWTNEEYELGFKLIPQIPPTASGVVASAAVSPTPSLEENAKILSEYSHLLHSTLATIEEQQPRPQQHQQHQQQIISEEQKKALRDYRLGKGISSEIHFLLLKRAGWTLDEYELGRKIAPPSSPLLSSE